ncbi:hypothetical protein J6590_044128 [Homalodisca vitripennis]|nr:hypothetical protein J6590_044128 [Homalodisca vitripennis]
MVRVGEGSLLDNLYRTSGYLSNSWTSRDFPLGSSREAYASFSGLMRTDIQTDNHSKKKLTRRSRIVEFIHVEMKFQASTARGHQPNTPQGHPQYTSQRLSSTLPRQTRNLSPPNTPHGHPQYTSQRLSSTLPRQTRNLSPVLLREARHAAISLIHLMTDRELEPSPTTRGTAHGHQPNTPQGHPQYTSQRLSSTLPRQTRNLSTVLLREARHTAISLIHPRAIHNTHTELEPSPTTRGTARGHQPNTPQGHPQYTSQRLSSTLPRQTRNLSPVLLREARHAAISLIHLRAIHNTHTELEPSPTTRGTARGHQPNTPQGHPQYTSQRLSSTLPRQTRNLSPVLLREARHAAISLIHLRAIPNTRHNGCRLLYLDRHGT